MTTSGYQVAVLPDPSWVGRSETIGAIRTLGLRALDVDTAMESKAICAALISAQLAPPVVVVARGNACLMLPAVALSLRTQHKDTSGYVLVDPDAPPATDTWPESPVLVVSSTEATGTSLRGWTIVRSEGDEPVLVARSIGELLQLPRS